MPPTKSLSPTEWRIMHVCWRRGRPTIAEILHDLANEPPVASFHTVRVLLDRMEKKGFLEVEEKGRRPLHFVPTARQSEVIREAVESFVDSVLAHEPANVRILEEVLEERQTRLRN